MGRKFHILPLLFVLVALLFLAFSPALGEKQGKDQNDYGGPLPTLGCSYGCPRCCGYYCCPSAEQSVQGNTGASELKDDNHRANEFKDDQHR